MRIKNTLFRSFYTHRQSIKQLLDNKNENLIKKIENNLFITEKDTIYDCANLLNNTKITLIPIVNNSNEKKLVSSLHKKEVEKLLEIQEFHDYEDYKNWSHIKGNHG